MSEVLVSEGDWVLFNDSGFHPLRVDIKQAAKVTPKLVKLNGLGWPRQCHRLAVVAAVADEQTALRLRDSINGVAGEFQRRQRAAEEERSRRVSEARQAATKQIAKIVAAHPAAHFNREEA